ncbi:MAG: Ig-like domain-containing protein, partial [Actinobacteria bacterium]|nr:Ig-like domain-containing protein [Actinomycetota bacterium]
PPGTHEVSVRSTHPDTGEVALSRAFTVFVPAPLSTALALAPAAASIPVGGTVRFVATETFSNGTSADVTARATLESLNPSVATIASDGTATGLAPGTTTIRARADGFIAEATLTVSAPALAESSPGNGEANVAVTRETILRFTALDGHPHTRARRQPTTPSSARPGSVSETEPTTITFTDPLLEQFPHLEGVEITVPADSLYHDDGTRGGQVGIAPVPSDRLPGRLPEGLDFPIVITVQTDGGENFDVPVPLRMPNLEGLPPGARSALWSFNHDTGEFEVVGSMTVTPDGLFVVTDPGVGILAPGWHGVFAGVMGLGDRILDFVPSRFFFPELFPDGPQENVFNGGYADDVGITPCNVFLHNGEEHFDRVDLAIPGRGDIHFRMERRYRSRIRFNGPLGHGWDFTYNETLRVDDATGDVTRENGQSHLDTWRRNADGSYAAPAGYFGTLIRDLDGTYVLREPNGFKRLFNSDGQLLSHVDRFGNRLLFEYDFRGNIDVVVDPYGREIDFVYATFTDQNGDV